MNTEWKILPTIKAVAKAKSKKGEIEVDIAGEDVSNFDWKPWNGVTWGESLSYRGRKRIPKTITPKPPETITIKLLAWYDGESLAWYHKDLYAPAPQDWLRVPDEDKTIVGVQQ